MSDTTPTPAKTFTAQGQTIALADLPESSIHAMISRGISHYLGNEVASKVSGFKENFKDAAGHPATPTEEQVQAKKAELVQAAVDALLAGTVGTRQGSGEPKASPLEAIMVQLATVEISALLAKVGHKLPTKDNTIKVANGDALTRKQLIDRRLAHPDHGPRLQKEAEAELKARARKAEKVQATASGNTLEDLGL